jgi:RNA-binding motif protein, X-linked 2
MALASIRSTAELNEEELRRGITLEASWHWQYRTSAWVYVGGLDSRLSVGDVICVLSQ